MTDAEIKDYINFCNESTCYGDEELKLMRRCVAINLQSRLEKRVKRTRFERCILIFKNIGNYIMGPLKWYFTNPAAYNEYKLYKSLYDAQSF